MIGVRGSKENAFIYIFLEMRMALNALCNSEGSCLITPVMQGFDK